MHIKIYLANQFIGISTTPSTTCSEAIHLVLDRLLIPSAYAAVCGIFSQPIKSSIKENDDLTQISLLSENTKLESMVGFKLYFRFVCYPTVDEIPMVDEPVLEFLQQQAHKFIVANLWRLDAGAMILNASFRCYFEFGPYKNQNKGFLKKNLSNFLPANILKQKNVEELVLDNWKKISQTDSGKEISRPAISRQYLDFLAGASLLYGSFAIDDVEICQYGKDKVEDFCILGCASDICCLVDYEGAEIAQSITTETSCKFMVDKFEVTIGKKAICKCNRGRDWYTVFEFMKADEHTYAAVFDELDAQEEEEEVEE